MGHSLQVHSENYARFKPNANADLCAIHNDALLNGFSPAQLTPSDATDGYEGAQFAKVYV